jgi:hypothetical protein
MALKNKKVNSFLFFALVATGILPFHHKKVNSFYPEKHGAKPSVYVQCVNVFYKTGRGKSRDTSGIKWGLGGKK